MLHGDTAPALAAYGYLSAIVDQTRDRAGQSFGVAHRHGYADFRGEGYLRQRCSFEDDYRLAAGHGLDRHHTKRLSKRRHDEEIGCHIGVEHRLIIINPAELDDLMLSDELVEATLGVGRDDRERLLRVEFFESLYEILEALVRATLE